MRRTLRLSALAALTITTSTLAGPVASPPASEKISLGLRGVHFVENQGQWRDSSVRYGFRTRGMEMAFNESALTMHLARRSPNAGPGHERAPSESEREDPTLTWDRLTLEISFPGSHGVMPRGMVPQSARFNYFVGDDESKWAHSVPSFATVVYENLYDGIDLHVAGSESGVLKYEFHCNPGADYSQIRVHYDGIDSLRIDDAGDLQMDTRFGTLRDRAPLVWQGTAAGDDAVAARFRTLDERTYTIELLDAPDAARSIVIDPDLDWMYYVGGTDLDSGSGVACDSDGNVLAVGQTFSEDFDGRLNDHHGGHDDAFVLKTSPDGQLLWMTYLGGSDSDYGVDVAVDSFDRVLMTGRTTSSDFVGRINESHGGDSDGFVAKLSPEGQLLWMRYLGGSGNEAAGYLALTQSDDVLLAGGTSSTDFEGRIGPYLGGAQDAFVLKLDGDGNLQWMSYLGGTEWDGGFDVTLDADGAVLIAGRTASSDFAGRTNSYYGGANDMFVARVDQTGALQRMAFVGGSGDDWGRDVKSNADGEVFLSGITGSNDFVGRINTYHGGFTDASISRLTPLFEVQWTTYLGGTDKDSILSAVIDTDGHIIATGQSESQDFVGRSNAKYGGDFDAIALEVDEHGALRWMMYLGGRSIEWGSDIEQSVDGGFLIAGYTGSLTFEGQRNLAHDRGEAFLLRLSPGDNPLLRLSSACPYGGRLTISWEGATPGGQVAVLFARLPGSYRIPNRAPCGGTRLALGTILLRIVYRGDAGQDGARTINRFVNSDPCTGYMQVLDLSSCRLSNIERVE